MPDAKDNETEGCGCLIIYWMMYPFAVVVRGWSICWLWHWYAAPVTGYAAPSVLSCTGLAILVVAIKGFERPPKDVKPIDTLAFLVASVAAYVIMAFLGFVFYNLM